MNTILERRSLPDIDPETTMTRDVLDYAHEQLGYHHPHKDKLCTEGALANALRIAGIIPFSHASVREYKRRRVQEVAGGVFFSNRAQTRLLKTAGLSLGLALVGVIMFLANNPGLLKTAGSILSNIFAVLFIVSLVACVVFGPRRSATWKITPLKEYAGPVPGFALATAKEINQRVCGMTFLIDEMLVEDIQRDPFLVVRGNGEEYYVEVWAEPSYEQKRKA